MIETILLVLFVFGPIIGLIIWNFSLSSQIKHLTSLLPASQHPQVVPDTEIVTSINEIPIPKIVEKKEPPEKHISFSLEDFLGRKFFSILGVVSIVLALIFLSVWAFSNGYIGPTGQIAIGIIVSLLFLVAGEILRSKYPKFFFFLSSVGICGLIVTTFVARNVYGFLSPEQSFVAYIVEVGVGILLSLRYDSRVLGNFSVVGGLLAPILIQSPDMSSVGILTFLFVLAFAGFWISTQKKWPEILGVLFVGITAFEIQILGKGSLLSQPTLFLCFIFGMHYLLGSGGIVRCIREKISQEISKPSSYDIFDVLLLISSVLAANLLAYFIFRGQNWNHLGFFVLAQGFLFFGCAEWVKKYSLEIFQKLFLGATLAMILFATGWEIGAESPFVLLLAFLVEGAFFCFAAQKTKELLFHLFGCVALGIAFLLMFQLNSIGESTLAAAGLISGLIFSLRKNFHKDFDTAWRIIAFIFASIIVLHWSFDTLSNTFSLWNNFFPENEFLLFIIPILFGVGVTYSVLKTKKNISRLLGFIFLGIVNVVLFSYFISDPDISKLNSFLSLLLILVGNFSALTTYFISSDKIITSKNYQIVTTILSLSFSCMGILLWGMIFLEEPFLSAIWTIWGILLLSLGIKNHWPHFRYFGIGVFCFLIGKWYLFDIWGLATWVKFFAFGILGAGLLFVSFWYQKNSKK